MHDSLIKRPSAWLPIAMSLACLAVIVGTLARFGVAAFHEPDEGTPAHLFQILMGGQLPIVVYFAFQWLPRDPARALRILALQIGAAVPIFAIVYWGEHTTR